MPKESPTLEKIKMHVIAAFVSDETLMALLVLKGGNALNIAYDITNRGSIDIDFSMENDFSPEEKERLKKQLGTLLNSELNKIELTVFDVKFEERPKKIEADVKDFWGGYVVKFKIISREKLERLNSDQDAIRRNAIVVGKENSTIFQVDISKYEYIKGSKKVEIDGSVVNVYSPEMIAIEKLRAICQQNTKYKEVMLMMTAKARSRDFYDIYVLANHFGIDFSTPENKELARVIFDAKKVPLDFILEISDYKDLHFQEWDSVVQTIDPGVDIKPFEFYFDFVVETFKHTVS